MLIAEYDYATDIAVQRAEERKMAYTEGIEQGFANGSYQAKLETAQLMLQRHYPPAEICLMTGLTEAEVAAICK